MRITLHSLVKMVKNGSGQIILGYSNINTNRINIDVDCTCSKDSVEPISFSTYLKEILIANKEQLIPTLKISSQGLHISTLKLITMNQIIIL